MREAHIRRRKEACRVGPIRPQRVLPTLRVEIDEAAQILRISRSQLYKHVREGRLEIQKDGVRSLITMEELRRFVAARPR
jgi:excisionase family DNA binding protein